MWGFLVLSSLPTFQKKKIERIEKQIALKFPAQLFGSYIGFLFKGSFYMKGTLQSAMLHVCSTSLHSAFLWRPGLSGSSGPAAFWTTDKNLVSTSPPYGFHCTHSIRNIWSYLKLNQTFGSSVWPSSSCPRFQIDGSPYVKIPHIEPGMFYIQSVGLNRAFPRILSFSVENVSLCKCK